MGMAERIKEKRIESGLTQEELGEKLGLQKSAIAKYENGRVENIKRSVIADMAKIFNCSPAYLMGFDEPSLDRSETDTEQIKDKGLIVLYRKLEKVPDEERQMMIEQFNSSIDVFLKRKGLITEEE